MERLKRSVDSTDILERHTAVVESVTESPLTKGNKVTLLADGQATYAAMFKALQKAKDHINLESYIIEDDETGRKFADLLLQKQAEGVQVNIIYDSVGSLKTPESFFKRLRDRGIQVVEFNPLNPFKDRGEWFLTSTDHRKLLIVDGKVVILGGINISKVYSSSPLRWKRNEKELEEDLLEILQRARLRPSFTFENFAVSSSNQMAHAAAEAVSQSLGDAYNPLFIWGGVGVGKTHLALAIAFAAVTHGYTVYYRSAFDLVSDMADAQRNDTRKKYVTDLSRYGLLVIDEFGMKKMPPRRRLLRETCSCSIIRDSFPR